MLRGNGQNFPLYENVDNRLAASQYPSADFTTFLNFFGGKIIKLTPAHLSEVPTRFDVGDTHYDFVTQQRVGLDLKMATTFRGTQTHTSTGKPNDSDND